MLLQVSFSPSYSHGPSLIRELRSGFAALVRMLVHSMLRRDGEVSRNTSAEFTDGQGMVFLDPGIRGVGLVSKVSCS